MEEALPAKGAAPFIVKAKGSTWWAWAVEKDGGGYALFLHKEHAVDWINRTGRIPDSELPAGSIVPIEG